MSPKRTLALAVAHTPSNLVRLEMPPISDVLKPSRLLARHTVPFEVLHGEAFRAVYRRVYRDDAFLVPDDDARLVGAYIEVA